MYFRSAATTNTKKPNKIKNKYLKGLLGDQKITLIVYKKRDFFGHFNTVLITATGRLSISMKLTHLPSRDLSITVFHINIL